MILLNNIFSQAKVVYLVYLSFYDIYQHSRIGVFGVGDEKDFKYMMLLFNEIGFAIGIIFQCELC